jgi:hypothetical protein
MVSPTYARNKVHIYKWRATHSEHHKQSSSAYYKKYNLWKKIRFEFLNILIDYNY